MEVSVAFALAAKKSGNLYAATTCYCLPYSLSADYHLLPFRFISSSLSPPKKLSKAHLPASTQKQLRAYVNFIRPTNLPHQTYRQDGSIRFSL